MLSVGIKCSMRDSVCEFNITARYLQRFGK